MLEQTFQHAMCKDQQLILLSITPAQPYSFCSTTEEKVLSHNIFSTEFSKEIALFMDSCTQMTMVYVQWEIVARKYFLKYP